MIKKTLILSLLTVASGYGAHSAAKKGMHVCPPMQQPRQGSNHRSRKRTTPTPSTPAEELATLKSRIDGLANRVERGTALIQSKKPGGNPKRLRADLDTLMTLRTQYALTKNVE